MQLMDNDYAKVAVRFDQRLYLALELALLWRTEIFFRSCERVSREAAGKSKEAILRHDHDAQNWNLIHRLEI